jgi:aminocarboxymuconate-semialdehyde decarboxylase
LKIDVHAHCLPEGFLSWLDDEGPSVGVNLDRSGSRIQLPGRDLGPLRRDLTDVDHRLKAMDRMGIDVQLLSGWIDLTAYQLEPEAGGRFSRAFNRAMVEEAERHADRFGALATVPLQDPVLAAEVLTEAIEGMGMNGVQIATRVGGTRLDKGGLEPFWSAAERLRALVLLHPIQPLAGLDLDGYFLENVVGRPAETTISAASLILSGVLERHPDLRIVLVHGGGFLPFQIGRLDRGFAAKPELVGKSITRRPSDYLRQMYVDTVVHEPAVLSFLIHFLGADRIVLGSDHPFEMGDPDPIATISAVVGRDDSSMQDIEGGTLARLLGWS